MQDIKYKQHNRRSIRLSGYDYAQSGAYFVTACIQKRVCLFGSIVNGEMQLNDAGRIVQEVWRDLPARFPQVRIDNFIVMPNHIHGIILVGAQFIAPSNSPPDIVESPTGSAIGRAPTLGEIIRAYKAISTREIRRAVKADFSWQRNYYEHIVRNEESLNRIREYIVNNPIQWDFDRENPAVITPEPKDAWRAR
jgi:putative transposase